MNSRANAAFLTLVRLLGLQRFRPSDQEQLAVLLPLRLLSMLALLGLMVGYLISDQNHPPVRPDVQASFNQDTTEAERSALMAEIAAALPRLRGRISGRSIDTNTLAVAALKRSPRSCLPMSKACAPDNPAADLVTWNVLVTWNEWSPDGEHWRPKHCDIFVTMTVGRQWRLSGTRPCIAA